MFEFQFEMDKMCEVHSHPDIELFYVLDGEAKFCVDDWKTMLKPGDYLIVNAERKHFWVSDGEVAAANLHISYHELARLMNQDEIVFWCNSVLGENEEYVHVREILKQIFAAQSGKDGHDEVYLQMLYYTLLYHLTRTFLLSREDRRFVDRKHKYMERKQAISEYVRLNYEKPISLKELAANLYLSEAYLSKYIKRQFGMSFLEYVNSVRLGHALTELIYSDKPVVRIAMDNGFANSAALNKVFKRKYQVTPSVYRAQWKGRHEKTLLEPEKQKRLSQYLSTCTGDDSVSF